MKLRIIFIALSLVAFLSAGAGGYLYYSSVKNSAFEEANRQAAFHTETIKSHLSFFLYENLNSVRALAGLQELPQALLKKDEDSLLRVNFILNASEAMTNVDDTPRKIVISTIKEDEQRVKVGIRDSGIGIIEANFNQIIEPFYTTKPEGMGMGLSINRSIIDAHSGRLWAENNPDRGATFYFTFSPVWG